MLGLAASLLSYGTPHQVDPREATLGPFKPVVVVEIDGRIRRYPEIYSLYAASSAIDGGRGERFLVWRRQTDRSEWARATECPGAAALLVELEELQLPGGCPSRRSG
jgi:hypothetical protein